MRDSRQPYTRVYYMYTHEYLLQKNGGIQPGYPTHKATIMHTVCCLSVARGTDLASFCPE